MTRITEAELDRLRHEGMQPGRGADSARALEALATDGGALRAEALVLAGEVWERSGDDERAEAAFRAAVADGGVAGIDARTSLGAFLLERGRREEAVELFEAARRARPEDTTIYEVTGECFEAVGDLEAALRWFNLGYTRVESSGRGAYLLSGRARVRRALGLPPDALDRQDDQQRRTFRDWLEHGAARLKSPVLEFVRPFVAEPDWAAWRMRWPDSDLTSAPSYLDQLALLEQENRTLSGDSPISCVPIDLAGLLSYADAQQRDPDDLDVQDSYVDLLAEQGVGVAWPPARNDPCWCGSGVKYKKCCAVRGR